MAVQEKALDLETRIDRLESQFELHRLVSEYCHGVDKRDLNRFLDIWHEDAVWEIGPPFGNFEGKDEVWRPLVEHIWPASRETHHWTTNLVVEIDGDRARASATSTATAPTPTTWPCWCPPPTPTSSSDARAAGGISRRQVVIHYFSPVPGVDLAPPPPM